MLRDKTNWLYAILIDLHINKTIALYINLISNILLICLIAYIIDKIAKKILIKILETIATKTKTKFDDYLVSNKTITYFSYLIPLLFIYKTIPIVLTKFINWELFFNKSISISIVFITLLIAGSFVSASRDYIKKKPSFADKPIDSYVQIIKIFFWLFAIILIFSIFFNKSINYLLGTFGAVSAIIILIFKDSILGFVASIQVSVNDLVRIGDWITMDKFGADGDVIEINLATVKVQNFDKTTSTIPTYSLISDSFKNWRGMTNSGGRRIKRSLLIKSTSIKFIHPEDMDKFKDIQLITSYIEKREQDINKWNLNNEINKKLLINGRNLTNFGVFRKYVNQYLSNHPGINKDMPLMCRHLQPTPQGIPLEIYAFISDKRWMNYEAIIADIFDHLIASIHFFDLQIFESSTNNNIVSN